MEKQIFMRRFARIKVVSRPEVFAKEPATARKLQSMFLKLLGVIFVGTKLPRNAAA